MCILSEKMQVVNSFIVSFPALPDDVVPIFLSSKTQEIMACVPYEDVTEESPFKILKKEDIQKDMYNRAAISDFSPMKDMFNVSSRRTCTTERPSVISLP